jgi:hypothetical protein
VAEQLLFTWADRGLEGRGMWQVVAASEHLFQSLPRACQLARGLCTEFTYAPVWRDPATAPVSFGWRDIRGMRFAFRRVYRGDDGFGRPGIFAAHVLVDRPERLPADRLLRAAGSAAWWSGDPPPADGAWLPEVTLDEFGPAAKTEDDVAATEAVLTAVLAHKGRPVLLAMDPAVFGAALRDVARLLPGALDRIGVSTYEPPATRACYGLTAVPAPEEDPLAIDVGALADAPELAPHREVMRLVRTGERYAGVAWQAAGDTGDFLRVCSGYLAVRAGTAFTVEDVLPALQHPGTAAELLDELSVRTVVAGALGAGHAAVATAIRNLGGHLEPETWSSLGELTARAARTRRGLLVAAATLRAASVPAFAALIGAQVRLAIEDVSRVARWPVELLPDFWADPSARESKAVESAIVRLGAPSVLALAGNPSMPADLWARLLLASLTTGPVDVGKAARAVHGRPAFARAVGDTAPATSLELLLDSLSPATALELLSAWASPARTDVWIDLAARLAARLDDGHAWRAAAVIAPRLRRPAPTAWPALRDAVLRRRLLRDIGDPHTPPSFLDGVCRPELGTSDRCWHDYLSMLRAGPAEAGWPSYAPAVAGRVSRIPRDDRELAARFALHDLVARAGEPADVAVIAQSLTPALAGGAERIAELVLRGGLRGVLGYRSWAAGFAALTYVAVWLIGPGVVGRRKMTGELTSRTAQRSAVDLYAALAAGDPHLGRRWTAWTGNRPQAERWLRSLAG